MFAHGAPLTGACKLRAVRPLQPIGQHRHHVRQPATQLRAMPLEHVDAAASASQDQIIVLHRMASMALGDVSEGLEAPVQLLYLVALLGFLVVGAYLVVRQARFHPASLHPTKLVQAFSDTIKDLLCFFVLLLQ